MLEYYDDVNAQSGPIFQCLFYAVNLTITIVGAYCASKLVKMITAYCNEESNNSIGINELYAIYWSTALVCGIINYGCFNLRLYIMMLDFKKEKRYVVYILPLISAVFLIETIFIWITIKDFKIKNSKRNRYVLRAIHTCHLSRLVVSASCGMWFISGHLLYCTCPSTNLGCHFFDLFYHILHN